ncbi:MAG: hypothetical protein IKE10_01935 [Bacilli bacterium]|nr:hypothetical protein [Bacilli bacterium]
MKKRIILLMGVFLLCACSYDKYEMPKDAYINTNEVEAKVYSSESKIYDLIGDNNVEILTKNKKLDTSETGEKEIEISYKYGKRDYRYKLKYKVIDDESPIIISSYASIVHVLGDDFDLCDDINYIDNYDRSPWCEVIGEYDIHTAKDYPLKYKISDKSGNFVEEDVTLKMVTEKPKSNSSSPSKKTNISFKEELKKHKNENTMVGIDVSRWQEDIDFNKVKEAGCEFVIMRIGINSDIDKDISKDVYYDKYIKDAKEAGLKVGVYVFTSAINEDMAKEHAEETIKYLDNVELDFPVAYDFENWSKIRSYGINTYDLEKSLNMFAKTLKEAGYDTMLYSAKWYLEHIWINEKNYPVWLAHYTSETNYAGEYILWQRTNIGKIDGIGADVDIDIYYIK